MTPIDHRPAFCLWREECSLFRACAHSDDSGKTPICPPYKGPYCGHFIAKERDEPKKEKAWKTRRMARIALQSGLYKAWMKQLRRVVYEEYFYDDPLVHPVQYPQSLGELCIELAQESMQAHAGDGNYISYLLMSGMRPSTWPLIKSIRVLRIAMYHKEKA